MPNGRPTLYTPQLCEEIVKRAMLGEWSATNEQIADYAGVDVATVGRWKAKRPELRDAIRKAKVMADNRVEGCLHHAAVSGNVQAQIHWLNCRRPDEWRSKQEIDFRAPDGIQVEYSVDEILKLLHLPQEKKLSLARKHRECLEELRECTLLPEAAIDVEPGE